MSFMFPTKAVKQNQQAGAVGCCTSFGGMISMLVFDIL
jgi:hypothetical protein